MSSERLDILYCISHGFALRMVLQTKLLDKLSDCGLKVGMIGPAITADGLVDIDIDKNIKLIEFKPKIGFWAGQFQVLRSYVLEDVKGNTALWDKHLERGSRESVRENLKNSVYISVYYVVKLLPFLRSAYSNLERKLLHSNEASEILNNYKPKMVVSTYPVNWVEAILLQESNNLGFNTTIHLLSWDNISCKGRFPALSQNYLAWGPIMKAEFIEYYGIDPEKIHITGVPHFDLHHKTCLNQSGRKYTQDIGLKPNDSYIFFAMSAPRFAPREIDIVEWLAEQVNRGVFGLNMKLVVRPHPQNVTGNMADSSWLVRLNNIHKEKVIIDFPVLSSGKLAWGMQQNDMPRMSELLHNSIVCLNSGSTMSIDALLVETPVIITSFDGNEQLPYQISSRRLIDFPHLKKFIRIGRIPTVSSYKELKKAILEVVQMDGDLSLTMKKVVNEECGDLFGVSTSTVVNRLNELNKTSIKSVHV